MRDNKFINEEELLHKAIGILTEKLGPLETSRFLSISNKRREESIKRHNRWQATLDKKMLFDEVFKNER